MGLKTMFNPMGAGTVNKACKAYLLLGQNIINVKEFGIVESIEPEKTFGTSDSSVVSNYLIINGKLFYYFNNNLVQVGNKNNWTSITGYYDSNHFAFGIESGQLYQLIGSSCQKLGNLSNWTAISGLCNSAASCYAYGISGGDLYSISCNSIGASINLLNSDKTWTKICGYSIYDKNDGTKIFAYGINNKKLYQLLINTSVIQVGSLANWIDICGICQGDASYAYGLTTSKQLYCINGIDNPIATQVGTLSNWSKICGYTYNNDVYAYGISGLRLNSVNGTTVTRVGTLLNWSDITGYSQNSANGACAYGLIDGILYCLNGTSEVKTNLRNCISIFGTGTLEFPAIAICN